MMVALVILPIAAGVIRGAASAAKMIRAGVDEKKNPELACDMDITKEEAKVLNESKDADEIRRVVWLGMNRRQHQKLLQKYNNDNRKEAA